MFKLFFPIALVLLLISGTVQAAVTAVSTSPSSANVPINRSASFTMAWSVTSNTAGTVTMSSTSGQFVTPGGQVLRTLNKTISKTITGPGVGIVRETVLVPAHIILRTHKLGYNRVLFRRSFDDGGGANTDSIALYIVTAKTARFSISSITLRFSDDSPLRIVPRDKKHYAYATLSVVGSGLFKGKWEVADPHTANTKKPIFRPLKQVNRYLSTGDEIVIKSPRLPAHINGPYLLRLRVRRPQIAFDSPIIQYYVGEKTADKEK